jgi:nitroimidazol reductase NimA-like FMN-containing flavoprotein (pyridoxamine 5'-phosphate oxidase superfamily)
MLRKDKEITGPAEIEAIIDKAIVCRIALSDKNIPYIIPVCFGYQDRMLYFHCANSGKKLDIIRQNPNVCFEIETDMEIKKSETPCNWGMCYRSVVGFGKAVIVDSEREKNMALSIIMSHYSNEVYSFPDEPVAKTTVVRITVETMTGKQSGYSPKAHS